LKRQLSLPVSPTQISHQTQHAPSMRAFPPPPTILGGGPRAFLIEWKYAELCRGEDKYNDVRAGRYDDLITAEKSPFVKIEPRALYFEPFYQLMRQTLLGWQIAEHKDHGCKPEANEEFHQNITSPGLKGGSVSEAWTAILKLPDLYISTTPAKFMQPVVNQRDTKALTNYLQRRYWSGS